MEITSPTTFFDLPLEDLMGPFIAKHLNIEDIFAFRCCSKFCKELADSALVTNVTEISISGWTGLNPFGKKGRTAFPIIAQNCRRLRKIFLDHLEWLTDEMVNLLFKNNPMLEFVRISSCGSLSAKALYPLMNCKKLSFLFLNTPCDETFLQSLILNDIHLVQARFWDLDGVSNEALATFFEKQPRLQYISLSGEVISTRIFAAIRQGCKDLRCLEIVDYQFNPDDGNDWKSLLDNCPKLKDICMSEFEEMEEIFGYDVPYEDLMDFLFRKNVTVRPLGSLDWKFGVIIK